MDDTWDYLKTENAVSKFESYIRGWMKQIQELLLESEQLRLETDDAGPQVWFFLRKDMLKREREKDTITSNFDNWNLLQDELEYWKARGAKLTLLVNQINTQPARMTLVTLRAAQSKILKVWNNIDKRITKYHVEAADNAKFLGAIEKTSHSIYLEDPSELKGEIIFFLCLYTFNTLEHISEHHTLAVLAHNVQRLQITDFETKQKNSQGIFWNICHDCTFKGFVS